jgi:Ca2+-binding RTX toxin-like protein
MFDGSDLMLRLSANGDAIRFVGFDPSMSGMQLPIENIQISNTGEWLSATQLLSRGIGIIGTPEPDTLNGTPLADWFEGLAGNDTMNGDQGGDTYVIDNDGGDDTIIDSESGSVDFNRLILPVGTELEDIRLSFEEGFLILDISNTGNRVRLAGFDPNNPLGSRAIEEFELGLNGPVLSYEQLLANGFDIVGTGDGDILSGTALHDRLTGLDGDDLLDATTGGDTLIGGAGDDTYLINIGDGVVTINDVSEDLAGNTLQFGEDIDSDSFRNNLRFVEDGSGGYYLLIPYGQEGDLLRLGNFNPDDVLGTHAIEKFVFNDGTVVDYETLVSWTFVVEGDNSANALTGTNVNDRLYGYEEDDVLEAGDGDDVLTGHTGDDSLKGGLGRDAYVVNLGDGLDEIDDVVESGIGNILTFGEGINIADISVSVDADDLLVSYGQSGDQVRVLNYKGIEPEAGTVIDTFEFADGSTITLAEFLNEGPAIANPVADQVTLEDAAFSFVLPEDIFIDSDGGQPIMHVSLSGMVGQPSWLKYDPQTRTLFGTPENSDVGQFDVVVQGIDEFGATAYHSFKLEVQNTNDAPEVASVINDVTTQEDATFNYQLSTDSFLDVDAGDELNYSLSIENGDALPSWLTFNSDTLMLSGTPENQDVGRLSLMLTATDLSGEQANQVFELEITNVNDAPQVNVLLVDQVATSGEDFTWTINSDAFIDVDAADSLSYTAQQSDGSALPDWLAFDANTGTFSGTPSDSASYSIDVIATDQSGEQASQTVSLVVEQEDDGHYCGHNPWGKGHGHKRGRGRGHHIGRGKGHDKHHHDENDDFFDNFDSGNHGWKPLFPVLDRHMQADWEYEGEHAFRHHHKQREFEQSWSSMKFELDKLDMDRQYDSHWSSFHHGAPISGKNLFHSSNLFGSRGGVDSVSLAESSGTNLKRFSGLNEGFGKLPD